LYSGYIEPNGWESEGKDLEGRVCWIIEVLIWSLTEGAVENHESLVRIADILIENRN
jgi:hypothetical protein